MSLQLRTLQLYNPVTWSQTAIEFFPRTTTNITISFINFYPFCRLFVVFIFCITFVDIIPLLSAEFSVFIYFMLLYLASRLSSFLFSLFPMARSFRRTATWIYIFIPLAVCFEMNTNEFDLDLSQILQVPNQYLPIGGKRYQWWRWLRNRRKGKVMIDKRQWGFCPAWGHYGFLGNQATFLENRTSDVFGERLTDLWEKPRLPVSFIAIFSFWSLLNPRLKFHKDYENSRASLSKGIPRRQATDNKPLEMSRISAWNNHSAYPTPTPASSNVEMAEAAKTKVHSKVCWPTFKFDTEKYVFWSETAAKKKPNEIESESQTVSANCMNA